MMAHLRVEHFCLLSSGVRAVSSFGLQISVRVCLELSLSIRVTICWRIVLICVWVPLSWMLITWTRSSLEDDMSNIQQLDKMASQIRWKTICTVTQGLRLDPECAGILITSFIEQPSAEDPADDRSTKIPGTGEGARGVAVGLLTRGQPLLHAPAEGRHAVGQRLDHEERLATLRDIHVFFTYTYNICKHV